MGKVKGIDDFRREIYNGLVSKGYSKSYENFVQKNGLEAKAEDVWNTSVSNGLYDGDLDQFKSDFYGVKKKEASVPSAKSVEQSEKSYVNIAGVTESGSALEKTTIRPMAENIGFGAYATGRDLAQENRVKQIKEMRAERPGATIVEVKGDDGRLTMKFLEDHKQAVKNKAGRLPDAATIEAQPLEQSVEQYYQNKPDYLQMIAEREKKGYGNTYNQGKLVDQGITEMQRDVRNAIDVKAKEIGAATLNQYLNLNEQLKKTPENSPDYPKLVQDYQLFNEAHPDLAEYEGLVDRFWALNKKQQEAKKNPAYKDYYALQAKREQAQANADLFERTGIDPGTSGGIRNPFLPAATKEVFDLGTGVVRAAAGMQRWLTGQKYVGLDQVVENMERVLDPQNYASTATPSNRTQLVGQRYADVGNFRVLMDGDKIASVVTKDGGYRVRDQKKVDEVVQAFERDKPQIKTQALNPYTATDVIIGGATQLGLGLTGAGIGAKLGKAGSALANFGSKATSVATNAAGTYNKLYNSAIQELGAANQKAAERYAGIASMGMSLIGTLINPLEQQLLGQVQKNSIRLLAKELSEGVAEQTAVRNASRMLLNGLKTLGKEGALEGGVEALLDDAVKFGVNKTMLKNEPGFEIDLPQDILDNVAEETIGGLFGSVSASISPSTMQQESLINAYKSPNRAKILAKLDKNAAKHYEKVFAKADVTGRSVVDIHKEELVKAKTGEDYVAPTKEVSKQEGQAVSQPVESTPDPVQESTATTVKEIADGIDLQVGQKVTTPMGQIGTVIGFDTDQDTDEEGEGVANNYVVRMDESGEETVISIADYNKKVYEQGISKLQAQGMDRNEAEFAIEAARSLRNVAKGQPEVVNDPSVAPDEVQVEPNGDLTAIEEQPDSYLPSQLEGKKVTIDGETGFVEKVDNQYYLNNGEELLSIDDEQIEATVVESSPKGIRPNANRIGGQFTFKGETGTLNREGNTFTLESEGRIRELQPDDVLEPVNDRYIIDVKDNENATVNGIDYRIVTNESGNVVGLSPMNNPDQVITNERMVVAVEIKRNATVFNENKKVTPEEYQQEKKANPSLQTIENVLTVGMTEELSQTIDRLYNEKPVSDDEALTLDYWIDGRIAALNEIKTPESQKAIENLQTIKNAIYATSTDGSRTGSKGRKKVGRPKKDKLTAPQVEGAAISEPVEQQQVGSIEDAKIEPVPADEVFTEPEMNDRRKDGKKFYRLDDGKIEVMERKDGTASVTVIKTETFLALGAPMIQVLETWEFDSVEEAKDFALKTFRDKKNEQTSSEPTSEVQTTPDTVAQVEPTPTPQVQEQQASSEDIALAQKLLGEARAGLRQNLQAVADKAISALKKYGNLSVVFHDTNEAATEAYQKVGGKMKSVTGFYDPKTKTIHVSLESKNPTHTILHEALHLFIKNLDTAAFNKLFEELTSIPEYTQVLKSKGRSVKQHAALYPERSQKEEALVEYFAAIASGEIPVKRDSKVIQILNKLLKLMGFEGVVDNSNIRFFAEGIATALREGIEIEKFGSSEPSAEVEAEVIIDFPYYDQVAKLTEIGLQRGLSESQITSNITNALTAQGINADPAVVNAIYKARSATFKRKGKINNKALAKIKELHQKLFVSTGGGAIREMAERLDGTVMRYVDQVNALIRKAEKQSKNVDQDLVDRFLRDENSADEKQVIVDELRKAGFPESNLEQYQRRGTTRYQRAEMVSEFRRKTDDKINELTQKKGAILAVDLNTLYSTSFTIDDATRKQIAEQLRNAGLVAFANRYESGNTTSAERKLTIDGAIAEIDSQIKGSQSNLSSLTDSLAQQFIDSQMNDTDRAKVPDDLAETLTTMRQQIDNLSQYLIDEGYVVGDRQEVITQNLGQYMSDVYGIFKDEKFKPTKAAEEKAKKYFIQQIKNDPQKLAALSATGNDLDQEIEKEATRMVNDYIVKSKTKEGTSTGGAVGKKSEAIFKKKEGVPDELKDLLGKYTPLQEFAYTMYQLVSYVEKSKFQRRMVNLGKGTFMWDKNDPARPEDANYELKGFASAKLSGDTNPFKGMMVTKEVYDVLNGLDKLLFEMPGFMKSFLKFQGLVNKMKTVYSYQTHFGNVIGNLFFMAFNGMADISTLSSIWTARKAAGRDLFGRYGMNDDEVEEVLTILKNEGAIGNEVSIQAIRKTVGELEKSDGTSIMNKSANAAIGVDKAITDLYQAEDSFFKILAYLTERKRYANALYDTKYENLTPVQKEEVNRIATEIAKANWPNYNRMGKLTQELAKNNVVFGNFLSFTFEAMRTYGNTIGLAKRELQSPNPKVRAIGAKRTAGLIAGSLAADAMIMTLGKVAGGIFGLFFAGEDDTKLNRDLRIGVPRFLKGGDLLFTQKSTSVYTVVDLSAKNPLLTFRRHLNALTYTPSDEETATAVATQFLEAFFSKPIAMKYVDSINQNDNGKGDPIWLESDSGTERAEKIFAFTIKTIAPSSINSVQKLAASDDFWNTLKNQALGMNTYEIDYQMVWGKKIQEYAPLSAAYQGIRKELKKVASDEDATDREFREALREYNEKRKKQLDELMEVKQSMLNIMKGNEGADIVEDVIEESALSKMDKHYLRTGKWVDYKKSRNDLKYK